MFFFSGSSDEQKILAHYEAEARASHKQAWDEYNEFHRRKAERERRLREESEQWERERPERERREALKLAEEERARSERERQADLRRRLSTWQEAAEWARIAFENAYQDVAFHLAAEEGVTDPASVLKVFAVAYPSLPVAADWRMGCLRERAGQDARVLAIVGHLPSANAQNTRPT